MKKILLITFTAIGLSFLASSCVKESEFDNKVNEIVAAQIDSLNQKVAVLEKTQITLNDSLKSVKGDVEKLSEQSKELTDSIAAVKAPLAAQKKWTEAEVKIISDKVTAIEEAQKDFMEDVYARLGLLESRIQKIDAVPDYNDGSVILGELDSVMTFIIRPAHIADSIVKVRGKDVFTLIAIQALTKTASFDTLVIKLVASKDGVVSVTVDLAKLPTGYPATPSNAYLKIADGNSETTSGIFPLYYVPVTDLSADGTANCYIVSKADDYKFRATKGNSSDTIPDIKGVKVLWESFGTASAPGIGDIINANVSYRDGYISFSTNSTFRKGNAVIAAYSDTECTYGSVIWSWHIWCTDQPAKQAYINNAGTMMDRNLGATSTGNTDVQSLGLMYQWGRKDPFLGSKKMSTSTYTEQAKSTLPQKNPINVQDNSQDTELNLKVSIKNPATFIIGSDWYGTTYKNDSLWKTSAGKKTIYDPCPHGWRVPDGGTRSVNGVWAKAFDRDDMYTETAYFQWGYDFTKTSRKLMDSGVCWYPATGQLVSSTGFLVSVCDYGYYWSCTPDDNDKAFYLYFAHQTNNDVWVYPSTVWYRSSGYPVRCLSE